MLVKHYFMLVQNKLVLVTHSHVSHKFKMLVKQPHVSHITSCYSQVTNSHVISHKFEMLVPNHHVSHKVTQDNVSHTLSC